MDQNTSTQTRKRKAIETGNARFNSKLEQGTFKLRESQKKVVI